MSEVRFDFEPLQHVTITAYGLGYAGRVNRCIWNSGGTLYEVEYAVDGEIKQREFYADELKTVGAAASLCTRWPPTEWCR